MMVDGAHVLPRLAQRMPGIALGHRRVQVNHQAQALNELMGPRSRFGAGPLRLATWSAILVAAGAVAASPGVVTPDIHASSEPHASVIQPSPQFRKPPSCPVIAIAPGGACPFPALPTRLPTKPAVIVLCAESVCGSGFRPGDVVLLLGTRSEGSTFWWTVADRSGNFRSALPAPLCRFTPIDLTAQDARVDQSARLSLASTGCERSVPEGDAPRALPRGERTIT